MPEKPSPPIRRPSRSATTVRATAASRCWPSRARRRNRPIRPSPPHIYGEEYPLTRFFYVYANAPAVARSARRNPRIPELPAQLRRPDRNRPDRQPAARPHNVCCAPASASGCNPPLRMRPLLTPGRRAYLNRQKNMSRTSKGNVMKLNSLSLGSRLVPRPCGGNGLRVAQTADVQPPSSVSYLSQGRYLIFRQLRERPGQARIRAGEVRFANGHGLDAPAGPQDAGRRRRRSDSTGSPSRTEELRPRAKPKEGPSFLEEGPCGARGNPRFSTQWKNCLVLE